MKPTDQDLYSFIIYKAWVKIVINGDSLENEVDKTY